MKKIIVRKILKYDPTFDGKYSKYDGYRLIGLNKLNPGIIEKQSFKFDEKISQIFCSSLKRSEETALEFGFTNYLMLKELNEIKFDLKNLLTSNEYEKFGSNLVRKRFIEAFIDNKLEEGRSSIKQRIEKILFKLEKLPERNYLLISHSFFMKVLHVYLNRNVLFDRPKILRSDFDSGKKTFEFGEGFEFEL